jgi:hypothetical protein
MGFAPRRAVSLALALGWAGCTSAHDVGRVQDSGAVERETVADAEVAFDKPVGTANDGPVGTEAPGDEADSAGPDGDQQETVALDSATESRPDDAQVDCAGLFCEDFERGALDPDKWSVTSGVNHVDDATPPSVIQREVVAHGKYAAHFHGKGNVSNDDAFIITRQLPTALLVHNFGRLYFYVTPKPTSGHMMMVLGGSTGASAAPKLKDFEVANIGGGWQLGFDQLDVPPMGEEVFNPPGQVPVGTWTCLEWEFNDQPDTDTMWIDGKELGTLDDQHINYPAGHVPGTPIFNGKSSGLVGGFKTFSFGFYDWHPRADFDLYYDDVVIDTKRVECL